MSHSIYVQNECDRPAEVPLGLPTMNDFEELEKENFKRMKQVNNCDCQRYEGMNPAAQTENETPLGLPSTL